MAGARDGTTGAPRPGDPRSAGPRPRGTLRDGGWVAFAAALVAVTVAQLVGLVHALATRDDVLVTGAGATLGFLITVVWWLTIWWLVAGAWRRSVWGCPFEHTAAAVWERRCQRHPLVDVAEEGPGGAADVVGAPGDA